MIADGCKFWHVLFGDGVGGREAQFFEVLELALLADAEIEVRTGSETGAANKADGFADFDVFSGMNKHF